MSIRLWAASILAVSGVAGSAGAWMTVVGDETTTFPILQFVRSGDLALFASGDAVAAGSIGPPQEPFSVAFAVARVDGDTGNEVWSYFVGHEEEGFGLASMATSVDVDAAGDVLAAGTITAPDGQDLLAVKLDGSTGALLWTRQIAGIPAISYDESVDGAVDAAGDFIVTGYLQRTEGVSDFVVIKLDGQTGEELWRHHLTSDPDPGGRGLAVEIDAAGDVIAVGFTEGAGSSQLILVAKLDAGTGTELWRQAIPPLSGSWGIFGATLALDSQGNALVATRIGTDSTGKDMVVAKLAAGTGAVLWRRDLEGPISGNDSFHDVAVDVSDDVVAVGGIENPKRLSGQLDFIVIKFDGTDGDELWRQEIDGTSAGSGDNAGTVAVLPSGDVVAAGNISLSDDPTWTLVRLSGATGSEICRAVLAVGRPSGFSYIGDDRVVADAAGDIVAISPRGVSDESAAFTVVKMRGTNCGDFVVRTVPSSSLLSRLVIALALAGLAYRRLR